MNAADIVRQRWSLDIEQIECCAEDAILQRGIVRLSKGSAKRIWHPESAAGAEPQRVFPDKADLRRGPYALDLKIIGEYADDVRASWSRGYQ